MAEEFERAMPDLSSVINDPTQMGAGRKVQAEEQPKSMMLALHDHTVVLTLRSTNQSGNALLILLPRNRGRVIVSDSKLSPKNISD